MIFLEFHVTVDPERLRAFRQRHFSGPTTIENLNNCHIVFLSLCTLYPWKASRTDQGHINPHDLHDHASAGLSRLSREVAAPLLRHLSFSLPGLPQTGRLFECPNSIEFRSPGGLDFAVWDSVLVLQHYSADSACVQTLPRLQSHTKLHLSLTLGLCILLQTLALAPDFGSDSLTLRFGQVDNVHAPKMINIGGCCPPILRWALQHARFDEQFARVEQIAFSISRAQSFLQD